MLNFTPAPDLAALTDWELSDELGRLHTLHAAITKKLEAAKDRYKARGLTEVSGLHYTVSVGESTKWVLDQTGIRNEFGEAWCNKRSKLITSKSLRVKPTVKLEKVEAA
jgi:hypothetical protein